MDAVQWCIPSRKISPPACMVFLNSHMRVHKLFVWPIPYMTFPIRYAMANKTVFAEVDKYLNVQRKTEVNSCMSFVFWSDTLKLSVSVVCICIYYWPPHHKVLLARWLDITLILRDPAHSVSIFSCSLILYHTSSSGISDPHSVQDFGYLCAHTLIVPSEW